MIYEYLQIYQQPSLSDYWENCSKGIKNGKIQNLIYTLPSQFMTLFFLYLFQMANTTDKN